MRGVGVGGVIHASSICITVKTSCIFVLLSLCELLVVTFFSSNKNVGVVCWAFFCYLLGWVEGLLVGCLEWKIIGKGIGLRRDVGFGG